MKVVISANWHKFGSLIFVLAALFLSSCDSGGDGGTNSGELWLIPESDILDGGPGIDGIPALESPLFLAASGDTEVDPDDTVIVLRHGSAVKIYPHDIMDYHEVANDGVEDDPYTLSYCPLTGTAMAWKGDMSAADPSFGTTGFLYNSNLIMYDRETLTIWSQMLQLAVNGERVREEPQQIPLVETSYSTAIQMYPDAVVLSRDTGFSRDYDRYPYGRYLNSGSLLFPVKNQDSRLFPKARVVGIYSGSNSRVYQLSAFGTTTQTINDQIENQSIVVVGNSSLNFGVIYDRLLSDGTILDFSPIQDDLPNVMTDSEGNIWDIFGTAVSGPRVGTQLTMPRTYKAMWFAWVAFFPNAEIHFN